MTTSANRCVWRNYGLLSTDGLGGPAARQSNKMSRPPRFRSLAAKFSIFSALLVVWVTVTLTSYNLIRQSVNFCGSLLVGFAVMLLAIGIAQITSRVLVRPLEVLHDAMASVGEGRLKTIELSHTHDEIQLVGESFNRMIAALGASQAEVQSYQEKLEERIQQRTEALEEAMLRAQQANRTKSEFLANMSHELRTPLNGLLGMIDIVLESQLTQDQREQLETAQSCANTLLLLLNDILDLSKIEAGRMTLETVAFEPRRLAGDILKLLQLKAGQKGLELSGRVAPEVPEKVAGDPFRIRQILLNLLGNAVKFTEHGSVRLFVKARPSPASGKLELQMDVTDTGQGIPADKLSLIFDNFTQVDGSITRKYGGTGLGLAISRRLAEMHGGRIWVESEPGRGSVFHVVVEVCSVAGFSVEYRSVVPQGGDVPPSRGRLLLVEDNPINRKVVVVTLQKKGYEVELASNGQEAIEALDRSQFDLVLMDLQMPVLDGVEATQRIRANPRFQSLPIIALTAHIGPSEREQALEAGMNAYLTKPIRTAELLATVESYLPAASSAAH
jgi:two-component system, sensor histidine kinase